MKTTLRTDTGYDSQIAVDSATGSFGAFDLVNDT